MMAHKFVVGHPWGPTTLLNFETPTTTDADQPEILSRVIARMPGQQNQSMVEQADDMPRLPAWKEDSGVS
jgi:hypothetical protein